MFHYFIAVYITATCSILILYIYFAAAMNYSRYLNTVSLSRKPSPIREISKRSELFHCFLREHLDFSYVIGYNFSGFESNSCVSYSYKVIQKVKVCDMCVCQNIRTLSEVKLLF